MSQRGDMQLPSRGTGSVPAAKMMEFLGCSRSITHHCRMGYFVDRSSKLRPIKMKLKSASDASLLLSKASELRLNSYYSGVFISKRMARDEIKNLKKMRDLRSSLNKQY
jgi:hypothetical protein